MVQLTALNLNKIRLEIAQKGFTIRGFSRVVGVSHSYLSQILNGQAHPSPAIAQKIASGLGGEITDFFLINLVDEHTKEVTI